MIAYVDALGLGTAMKVILQFDQKVGVHQFRMFAEVLMEHPIHQLQLIAIQRRNHSIRTFFKAHGSGPFVR